MRFFRRFTLVLSGLFVLWCALAWSQWLPPTTAIQRKALAVIEAPEPVGAGQRNAFAALWLERYDIPAADLDRVMAADVARYRIPRLDQRGTFQSSADGHYRALPPFDFSSNLLCAPNSEDCLASVRNHADAVRAFVATGTLLVDHARALENFDYYRSPFPASFNAPIPDGLSIGKLQITDAALHFVDGDTSEGLARACSAALTWRRLGTHSDSLIVQMVGVANFHGAADLFADMLAEMPADAHLPDACATAFAPVTDAELSICGSMKGQYRTLATLDHQIIDPDSGAVAPGNTSPVQRVMLHLLFNPRATDALHAMGLAAYCTSDPDIQRQVASMRTSSWWQNGGALGALFNLAGSMQAGSAVGTLYQEFPIRMQDLRRMDDLIDADLDLRRLAASTPASPMDDDRIRAALPAGVSWDAQQHLLRTRRAYRRPDLPVDFTVPLAATRLQKS